MSVKTWSRPNKSAGRTSGAIHSANQTPAVRNVLASGTGFVSLGEASRWRFSASDEVDTGEVFDPMTAHSREIGAKPHGAALGQTASRGGRRGPNSVILEPPRHAGS